MVITAELWDSIREWGQARECNFRPGERRIILPPDEYDALREYLLTRPHWIKPQHPLGGTLWGVEITRQQVSRQHERMEL